MTKVTIWHNPRCTKSRQTLALLQDRGLTPEIRTYLTDPPSRDELAAALAALNRPAVDMVRTKEKEFKEAGLARTSATDAILDALAATPKLIERPIVFAGDRAAIGRPPEAVIDILET